MNALNQQAVLDFLASPESSGGLPVKRIDTHAASVFLSGSRALKVKRAVKFPYLDYSTLALRRQACRDEIETNRRFAPELYEGVVRITRESDGTLRVGGDGEVVEWAVQMQRFDDALTLDRYVDDNEIPPEMARAIAKRLAQVHSSSARQDPETWIAALGRFLEQHNRIFLDHPALFDREETTALLRKGRAILADNAVLIRTRAEQGLLVRGHGDLHLGNIALVKGKPVIFDAVEFDPVVAGGDVLYDLAFLLMDLWHHDQRAAANAALNSYLEASPHGAANLEGLRLLPLFLSVRSAIRAVVATARYDRDGKQTDARIAARQFEGAIAFLSPPPQRVIAIGGLSGTGKSHLARLLAPHVLPAPGAVVLRSDMKRKVLTGVTETTRLRASAYTREMSEKVYAAMFADGALAAAAGHSVILDAVFSRPEERDAAELVAKAAKVPFQGIFLHAELAERIRRVNSRRGDASDADQAVVLAQDEYRLGTIEWAGIESAAAPKVTLDAALAILSQDHS